MIEIFIEQIPEFTNEIANCLESQNWAGLGAIAHKAKSSVRTMGMNGIGDCLEQLEHFSKGNLKFEIQLKKEQEIELSQADEKNWTNVMHETKNDVELNYIPELVEQFLTCCPIAVEELKSKAKQL
jgi:HPt (histidine-containing phosphotransfer) domain-containing protein